MHLNTFLRTGLSASDQWLYLGSELVSESSPGCLTSDETCSVDSGVSANGILINGIQFRRGVVVHSPSRLMFRLDYKYISFKARIGVSTETRDIQNCNTEKGIVKFQVLGDGRILKINGKNLIAKKDTQNATDIQIGVGDVKILELETQHEFHLRSCALSAWAEAAVFVKRIPSILYLYLPFYSRLQNCLSFISNVKFL